MSEHTPNPGEIVTYITSGSERRHAVVAGLPDLPADGEVHLAVLQDDGRRLDLLALSVPRDDTGRAGTWHPATGDVPWPTEDTAR